MQNTNGGHGMSRFGSSVMAGEQILKLPFEKRYFIPGFLRRQMRKDTQAVLESLAQNRRHPRNIEQWLVSPANTIKSSTLHSRPPAKKKRGIEKAPQKAACTALNWLLINHCTVHW